MSTHNLCFRAKIRKIGIPLHTPVLLYESGVLGGIHYRDKFFKMKKGNISSVVCTVTLVFLILVSYELHREKTGFLPI